MIQEDIIHVAWIALWLAVFLSGFCCTVSLEPHASGAMATSTATSRTMVLSRLVGPGRSGDEI